MSNPCLFVQSTFAQYVKGLLENHSVEFTDEEDESTMFEKGGDHEALAQMVCDVDTSNLTIISEEGVLGGICLVNEYDHDKNCQTIEIYNYSCACEHLIPQDDEEE